MENLYCTMKNNITTPREHDKLLYTLRHTTMILSPISPCVWENRFCPYFVNRQILKKF